MKNIRVERPKSRPYALRFIENRAPCEAEGDNTDSSRGPRSHRTPGCTAGARPGRQSSDRANRERRRCTRRRGPPRSRTRAGLQPRGGARRAREDPGRALSLPVHDLRLASPAGRPRLRRPGMALDQRPGLRRRSDARLRPDEDTGARLDLRPEADRRSSRARREASGHGGARRGRAAASRTRSASASTPRTRRESPRP